MSENEEHASLYGSVYLCQKCGKQFDAKQFDACPYCTEPVNFKKLLDEAERINKEKDEKIKHLAAEVTQTAELVSGIQKERDSADEEERQRFIYRLAKDSRGYLRKDHLSNLHVHDLRLMDSVFESENARDYRDYFERRRAEEVAGKRRKGMSVGEYDQERKTWKE